MKRIRIHTQVQKGVSPFEHWTFDRPDRVTVGFAPEAQIWLLDAAAGPHRRIFERDGETIKLRVDPDLSGEILIDQKPVSFGALRDAGLLKSDARGEFVSVRPGTAGTFAFGEARLRFWVTPEPDDPEYPLHPVAIRILRALPVAAITTFIFALCIHLWTIHFLSKLPPHPGPTVEEVGRRFARLSIPTRDYIEKKYPAAGRAEAQKAKQAETKAPAPSQSGGFLSAAVKPRKARGGSSLESLFATESLGAKLGAGLAGKSVESLLATSLKSSSGGGTRVSTSGHAVGPLGIGSIRSEGLTKEALGRTASSATVSRLSVDLPTSDSGSVDQRALQQVLAAHEGELQDCYEKALRRAPGLSGKVVVNFFIGKGGEARDVSIAESSLADRGLHRCLMDRISAWPFPTPSSLAGPFRLPLVFFARATRG